MTVAVQVVGDGTGFPTGIAVGLDGTVWTALEVGKVARINASAG
jgi:hypothetical protein